jgi:putative transposase
LRADKNLVEKIDKNHPRLSIRRQAELLGIQRSNVYYKHRIKAEDDLYKKKILEIRSDPKMASYGVRRMARELRGQGFNIGRKRTKRLMKELGIRVIYCRPKTSIPNKEHLKYQYLLRNKEISNPNQVWSTDITYIKTKKGYLYLTAIIDWHSRYILSWELSVTMEKEFCIQALEKALRINTPEIFNSDQGVQYTSKEHTDILKKNGIKISMDGKGRCLDNVFIERFWRSIKYEYLNLKEYESIQELYNDIQEYIDWYNKKRLHQSLGYKTPFEIYYKNQNLNLVH